MEMSVLKFIVRMKRERKKKLRKYNKLYFKVLSCCYVHKNVNILNLLSSLYSLSCVCSYVGAGRRQKKEGIKYKMLPFCVSCIM